MSWWDDNPYGAPPRQRVGPGSPAIYAGMPEAVAAPGVRISAEEEAALRAQYPAVFNRPAPEVEAFGAVPQAAPVAPGYGGGPLAPTPAAPESGYGNSAGGWAGLATKAMGGMYGLGGGSQRQSPTGGWGLSPTPYTTPRQSSTPYPGGSTLGSVGGLVQMRAPTGQSKWLDRRQADRYAALGATRF